MLLFLVISILIQTALCDDKNLTNFENDFENQISDWTVGVVRGLERFNDRFVGGSDWGKMIGYDSLKPVLDFESGRGIKKMSMAMMPLVFHVGATSTWMLLTTIMAAKSVAIGLLLLVFKIAVSSAKVASFFTLLKTKAHAHHHHEVWNPHGEGRRFNIFEAPHGWNSHGHDWTHDHHDHSSGYKTIPSYKENDITPFVEE